MSDSSGSVILDLIGLSLSDEERELLQHPHVGGVILFTRNFESTTQLADLCRDIRACRSAPILIAVDQEGGRVQRFREGFTRLPAMGDVGQLYAQSAKEGLRLAEAAGFVMAAELRATGVDLSFAPVLDLDRQWNTVIGDRSFGRDSSTVSVLAEALMRGMQAAGMAATGKHFPGHGGVRLDSHLTLPIDSRSFSAILQEDMQPFIQLMKAGLDALMPAHILFPEVDSYPVGFSRHWLRDILRDTYHFSGSVFSDDLNMAGAEFAGSYSARAEMALEAGCDMVLICNNRAGAIEILDKLPEKYKLPIAKLNRLTGRFSHDLTSLQAGDVWREKVDLLTQYRMIYDSN
ncbi:MAG TPA: beta-N-acetylhexosaminidase [Gammaproteobacteria bacterium]|nr:beta-N-acetylhexosaminidase [Gammaproteobacteria bacterium]